jgi:hypothetical protein
MLRQLFAAAAIAAVTLATAPAYASEGNPNPRVLPPQSHPLGKTYGEWGAQWYQWAIGDTPADMNPVIDETGEFGLLGDVGKVFFLAGTFGGAAERTVVGVPNNKPIFFPILNELFVATEPDETEELARTYVEERMDAVTSLEAAVDGVELKDLFDYRADSPAFTFIANEGSIATELGLAPGPYGPAVTAGYWVMLAPLQKGDHVITFSGFNPFNDFSLDVTYHLTVVGGKQTAAVPEPASATLAGLGLMGCAVLCRKRRA